MKEADDFLSEGYKAAHAKEFRRMATTTLPLHRRLVLQNTTYEQMESELLLMGWALSPSDDKRLDADLSRTWWGHGDMYGGLCYPIIDAYTKMRGEQQNRDQRLDR